eukprot:jgi/Tetstr1/438646/TSEL_027197.t1
MDNTRLPEDKYDSEGCGGGNAASSTTGTASPTALVHRMLLRLDELDSRASSIQQPPPQKPIPATPADGVEGDEEEDKASPGLPAKSPCHAAFIDPRDWIDYLPGAYAEAMPHVGLTNPGLWNPRNDEWDRYPTDEKKKRTRRAMNRLAYLRRFKCKKTLTGEERVAERLVYSRFFDTTAAERSSNGVDGLLNALDDKQLEVTFLEGELARFAESSAWEFRTCRKWVSRLFLVPKPGVNQWRCIIDLRVLNSYCVRKRLKMETLLGVRHLTKKGDYMFSFDLLDGF